jgi:hypothetical protein
MNQSSKQQNESPNLSQHEIQASQVQNWDMNDMDASSLFDSYTTLGSPQSNFDDISSLFSGSSDFGFKAEQNDFNQMFNPSLFTMPPSQMNLPSGPLSPPRSPTDIFQQSLLVYQQPIQNQPNPNAPKPLTASQKKKIRENARNLVCNNCKTTKTPLWRRSNCKSFNLCNACGLYEKQYGEQRPVSYVHKPQRAPRSQARINTSPNGLEELLKTICSEGGLPKQGSVTLNWSQLEQLLRMARGM